MQHTHFRHALVVRAAVVAVSLLALSATCANAAAMKMGAATPPPKPSAAESAFIGSVARALQAKFGDVHAAESAGYYRTTRLEPDGTIIYFNNRWNPSTLAPNFLWYDKHGPAWRRLDRSPATSSQTAAAPGKTIVDYVHPKPWDLGFWLVPNPNGAFADLNPKIKP